MLGSRIGSLHSLKFTPDQANLLDSVAAVKLRGEFGQTHGQSLFRTTDSQLALRPTRATLGTGCPRSAHPTDCRDPPQSRVHHTNSEAQKTETKAGFTRLRRRQGTFDREATLRPHANH